MNVLTADETLQDRLRGLVEPVEVRDETGKVLGHYTPVVSPEDAALYEKAKRLFDPEEIKRRKERARGETGCTLDQIMERLRAMENGK